MTRRGYHEEKPMKVIRWFTLALALSMPSTLLADEMKDDPDTRATAETEEPDEMSARPGKTDVEERDAAR
jgi:hypothetical protein